MQVMPFWPRQLGVQNQLVRVAPNIRMGCEILRYYLRAEHRNWTRALARYNGSVGRNTYPALGDAALAAALALLTPGKLDALQDLKSAPTPSPASSSCTLSTRAMRGPAMQPLSQSSIAAAAPCATTSTDPSGRFRA